MPYPRQLVAALLVVGCVHVASAATYEERSAAARVGYNTVAAVANVLPIVSAVFAPECLPGYILCKLTFAIFSVAAAGDQWMLSGGSDPEQTRAILHRGFSGDWVLTGKHIAGDAKPIPLPEAAPPRDASAAAGGWEPPPR